MSSLRKSAFTEYAGVPEPKLEDVPLQGVGQTGLVLLQEDGRVLRRSGGGVYPAPWLLRPPLGPMEVQLVPSSREKRRQ